MVYDWNNAGGNTATQPSGKTYDWSKGNAQPTARQVRAELYRRELDRLEREGKPSSELSRDEQLFRVEVANREADRLMKSMGGATSAEMSEKSAVDSVADGFNMAERAGHRFYRSASGATYGLADLVTPEGSRFDRDEPGTYSYVVNKMADASQDRSKGFYEAIPDMAGYMADPVFLGTYGVARAALAPKVGAESWKYALAADVVAGVPADALSSGLRNEGDVSEMATDVGLGVGGAIAGDFAMRGIGKLWKKMFPGEPLPKSQSEARARLEANRAEALAKEAAEARADEILGRNAISDARVEAEYRETEALEAELERNREVASTLQASDDAMRRQELQRLNHERQASADAASERVSANIEKSVADAGERVPTGDERFAAREAAREQIRLDREKGRMRDMQAIEQRGGGNVLGDPRGEMPDADADVVVPESAPASHNTFVDVSNRKVADATRQMDEAAGAIRAEADNLAAAESRAAEIVPDEVVREDVYGARSGTSRFEARKAKRAQMQDPGVPELPNARPEVEADVVMRRVEEDAIREDMISEYRGDERFEDEVEQLVATGQFTRTEAEDLALGLDFPEPQVSAAGKSAVGESPTRPVEGASGDVIDPQTGLFAGRQKQEWELTRADLRARMTTGELAKDLAEESELNALYAKANKRKKPLGKKDQARLVELQAKNRVELTPDNWRDMVDSAADPFNATRILRSLSRSKNPSLLDEVLGRAEDLVRRGGANSELRNVAHDIRTSRSATPELKARADALEESVTRALDAPPGASGDQLQMFRSGIAPDDIAAMVSDAIAAGKWTAKQSILATRWAMSTAGDAIKTMRDFAGVMIDKFGRGIRKHIPEMWQRYKDVQARRAKYAQRRQRGAIDLRGQYREYKKGDQVESFAKERAARKAARAALGVKDEFDRVFDINSDRLMRISPRIATDMERYVTRHEMATKEAMDKVTPYFDGPSVRKMPRNLKDNLDNALMNGDSERVAKLIESAGSKNAPVLADMLGTIREVIDDIRPRANAVGMKVPEVDNYFPRSVKHGKVEALMKAMPESMRREAKSEIEYMVRARGLTSASQLARGDLDEAINRALMSDPAYRPEAKSTVGHTKKRGIAKIPKELQHFYEPFDQSFSLYVRRMEREIAKRRLLGVTSENVDLANTEDMAKSMGRLLAEEGLDGRQSELATDIIQSIFKDETSSVGEVTQYGRDATLLFTMGQVAQAAGNLPESLVMAPAIYGPKNVAKAFGQKILGKSDIRAVDVALDHMHRDYSTDPTKWSGRLINKMFTATGFKHSERHLVRDIITNSAYQQMRSRARKNPGKLVEHLEPRFGKDAKKLVDDLRNGVLSEDVITYIRYEVGKIQPLTSMQSIEREVSLRDSGGKGLTKGKASLLYQLQRFMLRRAAFVRREGLTVLSSGIIKKDPRMIARGLTMLAYYATIFTGADFTRERIMSFIYQNDETYGESATDAMLGWAGMNRYVANQMRNGSFDLWGVSPSLSVAKDAATTAHDIVTGDPLSETRLVQRAPHARTLQALFGDDEGGRPGRPERPSRERPNRPERPSR